MQRRWARKTFFCKELQILHYERHQHTGVNRIFNQYCNTWHSKYNQRKLQIILKQKKKRQLYMKICSWGVVEKYNETNFKKQMFLSNYIQLEVVLFSIITLCSYWNYVSRLLDITSSLLFLLPEYISRFEVWAYPQLIHSLL